MTRVDEIKRQAVRLMAEKGYEAMSLRQLAAAVGMRPGSIYTHYQSKSQLLLDVCCEYQDELMAAWRSQSGRSRAGPQDRLLRFAAVYLGFCHARLAESRIVHLDFRSLDEPGRSRVAELRQRYEAELEGILRQGGKAGAFLIADTRQVLWGVLAVLQGFGALAGDIEADGGASAFEACAAALLRLVGAHAGARSSLCAVRLYAGMRAGDGVPASVPRLSSVG